MSDSGDNSGVEEPSEQLDIVEEPVLLQLRLVAVMLTSRNTGSQQYQLGQDLGALLPAFTPDWTLADLDVLQLGELRRIFSRLALFAVYPNFRSPGSAEEQVNQTFNDLYESTRVRLRSNGRQIKEAGTQIDYYAGLDNTIERFGQQARVVGPEQAEVLSTLLELRFWRQRITTSGGVGGLSNEELDRLEVLVNGAERTVVAAGEHSASSLEEVVGEILKAKNSPGRGALADSETFVEVDNPRRALRALLARRPEIDFQTEEAQQAWSSAMERLSSIEADTWTVGFEHLAPHFFVPSVFRDLRSMVEAEAGPEAEQALSFLADLEGLAWRSGKVPLRKGQLSRGIRTRTAVVRSGPVRGFAMAIRAAETQLSSSVVGEMGDGVAASETEIAAVLDWVDLREAALTEIQSVAEIVTNNGADAVSDEWLKWLSRADSDSARYLAFDGSSLPVKAAPMVLADQKRIADLAAKTVDLEDTPPFVGDRRTVLHLIERCDAWSTRFPEALELIARIETAATRDGDLNGVRMDLLRSAARDSGPLIRFADSIRFAADSNSLGLTYQIVSGVIAKAQSQVKPLSGFSHKAGPYRLKHGPEFSTATGLRRLRAHFRHLRRLHVDRDSSPEGLEQLDGNLRRLSEAEVWFFKNGVSSLTDDQRVVVTDYVARVEALKNGSELAEGLPALQAEADALQELLEADAAYVQGLQLEGVSFADANPDQLRGLLASAVMSAETVFEHTPELFRHPIEPELDNLSLLRERVFDMVTELARTTFETGVDSAEGLLRELARPEGPAFVYLQALVSGGEIGEANEGSLLLEINAVGSLIHTAAVVVDSIDTTAASADETAEKIRQSWAELQSTSPISLPDISQPVYPSISY